jgi:hypothetical protein
MACLPGLTTAWVAAADNDDDAGALNIPAPVD